VDLSTTNQKVLNMMNDDDDKMCRATDALEKDSIRVDKQNR